MPQLDLLRGPTRTAISWHYSIDPLKPEGEPMFSVMVHGPRSLTVEYGLWHPPLNVIHEAVTEMLVGSWEAYLFGEPDDVRKAIGAAKRKWGKQSAARRSL